MSDFLFVFYSSLLLFTEKKKYIYIYKPYFMFVLFITVELCLYRQLIFDKEVDVS